MSQSTITYIEKYRNYNFLGVGNTLYVYASSLAIYTLKITIYCKIEFNFKPNVKIELTKGFLAILDCANNNYVRVGLNEKYPKFNFSFGAGLQSKDILAFQTNVNKDSILNPAASFGSFIVSKAG